MKKRYRLIKEYPGSPKINTEISFASDWGWIYKDNEKSYMIAINPNFPTIHQEFWEEIVEKDYEILGFHFIPEDPLIMGNTFFKQKDGLFTNEILNKVEKGRYSEEDILSSKWESGHWTIYSVKRLSDGEIFTIGDTVENISNPMKYKGKISSIEIKSNIVAVYYQGHDHLSSIRKVKFPLFTAEDGVEIFEGDKNVFAVGLEFRIFEITPNLNNKKGYLKYKTFSTKEAAEEYILMNKPCLSINNILNRFNSKWSEIGEITLKKLVKSKL